MRLFFTEKPTSLSTEKEAKRDERIGRSSLEIQISINLCLFLISRADSLISGSSSIQWLSSQKQCPSRCCHLQLKASGDAAEGAEPGHWTCRTQASPLGGRAGSIPGALTRVIVLSREAALFMVLWPRRAAFWWGVCCL